ncbi:MAG: hypothetical protein CM15mP58_16870 [Burkholderiaceae bacterium]|nr:MAG: hypothetical protein CM15mP58_16870 [Burkholderiaceae bacterium]
MGLGSFPATDKQFLGMPGMHGLMNVIWRCKTVTFCWLLERGLTIGLLVIRHFVKPAEDYSHRY